MTVLTIRSDRMFDSRTCVLGFRSVFQDIGTVVVFDYCGVLGDYLLALNGLSVNTSTFQKVQGT